jgi:hypothetical protein
MFIGSSSETGISNPELVIFGNGLAKAGVHIFPEGSLIVEELLEETSSV